MNTRISVIVPCYNQGQFLTEAIESIQATPYKNLEIIIINDGSSDNTEEITLELQKKYENIKYLYQKNQGPSVARNNAISKCTGEFIIPIDADDKVTPNYIPEAAKILYNRPEVKVVYCDAEYFGDKTGKWELPDFDPKKLVRKNMIFACSMYRKTDWERIGGYAEEMTWGWEDWEFWISMLKSGGDVYKLPFVGFFYRIKQDSRRKSAKKEGKRKTIDFLNIKHKEFIYKELGGPLHYQRKMSKVLNLFRSKR